MTLFDLLFILVFLSCVVCVIWAAWNAIRGRRDTAVWILKRLGILVAAYLATVAVVALASPRRVIPLGQEQCADDWCIAVVKAVRWPSQDSLAITVRVSSHARRVEQSAPDATVYVLDSQGRSYEVSAAGQRQYEAVNGTQPALSVRLHPAEAITTTRVFDVPAAAPEPALVLVHGGWPGFFVIGDSNSILHKRTVLRLK